MENKECEHNYIHYKTHKSYEHFDYVTKWKLTDEFYCTKCLDIKEKVKQETSRKQPDWY